MQNKGISMIFLGMILLLFSCEDTTDVGSGLLGSEDLRIEFDDDFSISAKTVSGPPVSSYTRTNNLIVTQLLGQLTDPIFGEYRASVYTEARLQSAFNLPEFVGAKLDSILVRFQLDTLGIYGDRDDSHRIEIFRLREKITGRDTIYSDKDFIYDPEPIGVLDNFKINNADTLFYYDPELGDTLAVGNAFSIPISMTLGNEILQDSAAADSDEGFKNLLNGFYVRSKSNHSSFGLRLSTTGGNNLISIYYTDIEGKKRLYNYFLYGVRSVRFHHDFRGTAVSEALDKENSGDEPLYLQGMAGTNVRLDLSDALRLKDYLLNYAELELTVHEESLKDSSLFPLAKRIAVLEMDANGRLVEVIDVLNGRGNAGQLDQFYGGNLRYDPSEGIYKYQINLSTHFKKILKGRASPIIYLAVMDKVQHPNRVLLNGPTHPTHPLKLKLTYTKP